MKHARLESCVILRADEKCAVCNRHKNDCATRLRWNKKKKTVRLDCNAGLLHGQAGFSRYCFAARSRSRRHIFIAIPDNERATRIAIWPRQLVDFPEYRAVLIRGRLLRNYVARLFRPALWCKAVLNDLTLRESRVIRTTPWHSSGSKHVRLSAFRDRREILKIKKEDTNLLQI